MPDWLEFHDSTLTAIETRDTQVDLLIDAYIHRWESLNGAWKGAGWIQFVRIAVSETIAAPAITVLPAKISDGGLQIDTTPPNNLVPIPRQVSGVIKIRLQLATAAIIELTGTAVRIQPTAAARYIEELPPDLRPQDPKR